MKKLLARGDILILTAMALFGSYSLFLRLLPNISTVTFVFIFQLVGVSVFYFLWRHETTRKLTRHSLLLLILLAIAALGNDLLYFAAFRHTTVANATIAHQSVSIFLIFLAPVFLRERTERAEWLSLVPAILGIGIMYSSGVAVDSSRDVWGITYGILAGFCYALLIILYRIIPNHQRLSVSVVNFWRYFFSVLFLLPFLPLLGLSKLQASDAIPLLGFGLLFAVIASGIHTLGLSKARSLHASILGKSEPVFAILYALVFLQEKPTAQVIIGGLLIVGASVWLVLRKEQQISAPEALLST
jgi:drug/metabolite transporter (DMT)-like permease